MIDKKEERKEESLDVLIENTKLSSSLRLATILRGQEGFFILQPNSREINYDISNFKRIQQYLSFKEIEDIEKMISRNHGTMLIVYGFEHMYGHGYLIEYSVIPKLYEE